MRTYWAARTTVGRSLSPVEVSNADRIRRQILRRWILGRQLRRRLTYGEFTGMSLSGKDRKFRAGAGKDFPGGPSSADETFVQAIAQALRTEFGDSAGAVKTVAPPDGDERSNGEELVCRHQQAGGEAPISLLHHSDGACEAILRLAGRDELVLAVRLVEVDGRPGPAHPARAALSPPGATMPGFGLRTASGRIVSGLTPSVVAFRLCPLLRSTLCQALLRARIAERWGRCSTSGSTGSRGG